MTTVAFSPWVDLQNEPDSVHHNGSPQRDPMPLDPERLKKWIRKGRWPVNHEIRQKLWFRLCMQKVMSVGSVYKEMAKGMFGDPATGKEKNAQLEMPSFGEDDHINTYKLSEDGKKQLTKLLCVMHHTRPDINYCPFLPSIASLLLHYMDTEQAFDALSALLGSQRYKYLEQTFIGFEAFRISFTKLVIKFASPAHKWIVQRGDDPEKVYEGWVWWVLDLPFTHLVRVIDVFLVEGLKIFYRIGLAIVVLHKKHRGGEEIQGDMASSIQEFVKTIPTSPEILLNVAFQFRGLSRSIIGTYQTKHQIELRAEGKVMSKSPSKQKGIPVLLEEIQSSIINSKQLQTLWKWLPDRIALYQPRLIFTSEEHGFSLNTFYLKCEQYEPTVLLVKTTNNEVFGAYLSVSWEERNDDARKAPYFGNGVCFMFTLTPKEMHYPWVGTTKANPKDVVPAETMYMRATVNELAIGGGDGEGIHLDKDLDKGYSQPCKTFNNSSLVTEADGQFQCQIIEVVVFEDKVSQENGTQHKSPNK
ncbi:LOW QUALITY PROTEIN: TBC1 domain family member 24-like [Amphiura filiformis]|uniref:LOW QUALITY PROTEIN: TBC1 domain family member 24-like n=1 Tax=Amphiura filiformis TaxID=82378 RepID=UPI003B2129F4